MRARTLAPPPHVLADACAWATGGNMRADDGEADDEDDFDVVDGGALPEAVFGPEGGGESGEGEADCVEGAAQAPSVASSTTVVPISSGERGGAASTRALT